MLSKLNKPNEEYGRYQMLEQIKEKTDCDLVILVRTLRKMLLCLETVITEFKIFIIYV
jgi:hypothetical protein